MKQEYLRITALHDDPILQGYPDGLWAGGQHWVSKGQRRISATETMLEFVPDRPASGPYHLPAFMCHWSQSAYQQVRAWIANQIWRGRL